MVPEFSFIYEQKPYKIPNNLQDFARQEVQNLLNANTIEKISSKYVFPIIFAQKKEATTNTQTENVKYRMAIYRLSATKFYT